jgi:hypothetical protein
MRVHELSLKWMRFTLYKLYLVTMLSSAVDKDGFIVFLFQHGIIESF